MRHWEALLGNPIPCPIVFNPMVGSPTPMLSMTQMPPQYDDLFPPNYNTLCLQITASITQTYTPPESFLLNPLLPILYMIPLHRQSLMTLMCFPQHLSMIQIWIGISDPIPQTPISF